MRARGKGLLFIAVVISFIIGGPLLSDSTGSAWAAYAPPSTYTVSGVLNPVSDLSSVYFVGMYTDGISNFYFAQALSTTFNANQPTSFTFGISYYGNAPAAYTILAVHGPGYINDAVTVGSNTISLGSSWNSSFGPSGYAQEPFSGMLGSGSAIEVMLGQFYESNTAYLGAPMGSDLRLVNFSDASLGGSALANASAVPLPATLMFFAPGLAGIAILRRRFKK